MKEQVWVICMAEYDVCHSMMFYSMPAAPTLVNACTCIIETGKIDITFVYMKGLAPRFFYETDLDGCQMTILNSS